MPLKLCSLFGRLVARLLNIVHADTKLYLVFEFLDVDLKRYMDHVTKQREVLSMAIVKVSLFANSTTGRGVP